MAISRIESQAQLDELLREFDWSHGFIREASLMARSYVEDKEYLGTVAPESSATTRLLFTFPNREHPGLELIFEEVEQAFFRFRVDLNPVGTINARDGSVDLLLYGTENPGIRAKVLKYVLLDSACWGNQSRYSKDNSVD